MFLGITGASGSHKFPLAVIALILINANLFLFTVIKPEVLRNYCFVPSSPSIITAFVSMFLHSGVIQIATNMFCLYLFGGAIESRLGHLRFLPFYIGSGIFATLSQYISDPSSAMPLVGASGAISSILGAYLVLHPKGDLDIMGASTSYSAGIQTLSFKAYGIIALWFILQICLAVAGLLGSDILQTGLALVAVGIGANVDFAIFSHIGGFLFGIFIALLVKKFRPEKPKNPELPLALR